MSNLKRFLHYLDFKGECVAHQQDNPVGVDIPLVKVCIAKLEEELDHKTKLLQTVMPEVPKYATKNKPKITHNKDGSPSKRFQQWLEFLREHNKPITTVNPVNYIHHYEPPNPNSIDQVKDWLFSLGWDPCTYKYVKEDDGSERKIPQVRYSSNGHPRKGELTDSVLALKDKQPDLEYLEGMTIAQHRLGIFRSFLEQEVEGTLVASIGGLTNTLRFKHSRPLVNLPGVDKPWGKEIRGSLKATKGYTLVGSDMVSLEATTKRHFIYPIDPDYAEEMSQPGFDEHLDLALKNGEVTQEQYDGYTTLEEDYEQYSSVKGVRKDYKVVNYSAVYGVGVQRLSRESGMPQKKAKKLLEAYWERNWSVKRVAEQQKTKVVNGMTWIQNPVSGFWHHLRWEKDRFSTLNQSTGVYVFDSWLARCAKRGFMGSFQFHDEIGAMICNKNNTVAQLQGGCDDLNADLNLNVKVEIDIKFGKTYADVH